MLAHEKIYMSSVTDPYQPIEKQLELSRGLIQELANFHKVFLVLQTRSPLVTRDIDLFKKFEKIQINMTVTTDNEQVRKAFEPYCPSNKRRLEAISEIVDAGIPACITITPMLPIQDPDDFASKLLATGVQKFIAQPFHTQKGRYVRGTRQNALDLLAEIGWSDKNYDHVMNVLKQKLPQLLVGKEGFGTLE